MATPCDDDDDRLLALHSNLVTPLDKDDRDPDDCARCQSVLVQEVHVAKERCYLFIVL